MSYGTNAPQGLVPSRYKGNSTWNGAYSQYPIASGYATALFHGDPVALLADGTIGIGAAGAACVGVFQGVSYTLATGQFVTSFMWPAGTVTMGALPAVAQIIDDPSCVFSIQTNYPLVAPVPPAANVGGLPTTAVNGNANFVAGAGNPLTGLSGFMLDQGSIGAGNAGFNLKIVALDDSVLNVPQTAAAGTTLAYNNALVTFNNHSYKPGTAGV